MTSHRNIRELLARRTELTPADERQLRVHLDSCPECRETAAAYEQQLRLLRSLPTLPTPPTLRTSVLNRIHAEAPHTVPWYRRRPALLPPLAAAAVLALVAVVWVAGQRLTAQRQTQNASSAQTATPTSKYGGGPSRTQVPGSVAPVTARTGAGKHSVGAHPTHHPTPGRHGGATSSRVGTSSTALPHVNPSPVFGGARFTATPVSFSPGSSVAAGIPTSSTLPTPIQLAATRPSRRHVSGPSRASSATSQARPTSPPPTSAPVAVAAGSLPTTPPPARPPAFSPIRGTPSPVAAVETPIVVITPGIVNTPQPIIPATPTPSPVAAVFVAPLTPTPTPTPSLQP